MEMPRSRLGVVKPQVMMWVHDRQQRLQRFLYHQRQPFVEGGWTWEVRLVRVELGLCGGPQFRWGTGGGHGLTATAAREAERPRHRRRPASLPSPQSPVQLCAGRND
jgi:hypothetical protein